MFEDNADGVPIVKKVLEKVKHKAETPFYNFSTDASLVDPQKALRKRQRKVLSFQAYRGYIRRNLYEREYHRYVLFIRNNYVRPLYIHYIYQAYSSVFMLVHA